jgi:hypothetical protein
MVLKIPSNSTETIESRNFESISINKVEEAEICCSKNKVADTFSTEPAVNGIDSKALNKIEDATTRETMGSND